VGASRLNQLTSGPWSILRIYALHLSYVGNKASRLLEVYTFEYVEKDVVDSVLGSVSRVLGFDSRYAGILTLPEEIFDRARGQYMAEPATRLVAYRKSPNSVGLLLADADAYVLGLNFVFGLAIPELEVASVFLKRLRLWTGRGNYVVRVVKEVLHELGHVLGLKHCRNRECVMSFSNSVFDVDRKRYMFCRSCAQTLSKVGIELPKEYVI